MSTESVNTNPKPSFHDYGIHLDNVDNVCLDHPLYVELYLMDRPGARAYYKTGTDASFHFWRCCAMLWGKDAPSRVKVLWNPWADRFSKKLFEHQLLGVSGCASSGKTKICAAYAILFWLADPINTKVLVTSTSLKEARKRIWGATRELFLGSALRLPGKLVDSQGQIRCDEGDSSDMSGIELVAGDPSKEKENVQKLIGIKNKRVVVLADELPELSPSLLEAVQGNLSSNPFWQMVGLGNFKSIVDAFGVFTEPLNGWKSVTVEDEEWPMKIGGECIRFDGTKSPNVLAGEVLYEGIYGPKQLEQHTKLGINSPQFWRMCRSFMCPEGEASAIYTEADLMVNGCINSPKVIWADIPTPVAFLDPAFVTGGDDCALVFGLLGIESGTNLWVLEYTGQETLIEDVTLTNKRPASFQKVDTAKRLCEERRVSPENFGGDATGAGLAFAEIIDNVWSPRTLKVFFGGAASDKPISFSDPRPGTDAYTNRVSEIWYQGLEFVRSRQIRGLPHNIVQQLTERRHTTQKGVSGLRIRVEPKSDMKLRLGRSPDQADAFLGLLEVCRTRLKFSPGGYRSEVSKSHTRESQYSEIAKKADAVYSEDCLLEND